MGVAREEWTAMEVIELCLIARNPRPPSPPVARHSPESSL